MYSFDVTKFRGDSADSAFVLEMLRHVQSEAYRVEYPENKARIILPVVSQGAGADILSYRQIDHVGKAKVISDYGKDLPRADAKQEVFSQRVRTLGASYGYSIEELRKAAYARMPLSSEKAAAARKALEDLLDDIAVSGDSAHDLNGFVNHAQLGSELAANTGAGSSRLWSSKTPDQVLADLNRAVSAIRDATKGIHSPDTIALPEEKFTYLAQTRMTDLNVTILSFFLSTQPFVKSVVPWHKLKGKGASTTDRLIAFKRSPDVVRLEIPSEIEFMEPERRGLEWTVSAMLTTGGIVMPKPKACYAIDGF